MKVLPKNFKAFQVQALLLLLWYGSTYLASLGNLFSEGLIKKIILTGMKMKFFVQNFVDLAGSERVAQALSAGARLKEGCHINRSLLTLGTVIRKLRFSSSSIY